MTIETFTEFTPQRPYDGTKYNPFGPEGQTMLFGSLFDIVIAMGKISHLLVIALLAALIYSNTFSSSFHFDDVPNIVENSRIKDGSSYLDLSNSRYIGFLSFALNDHFHGLDVTFPNPVDVLLRQDRLPFVLQGAQIPDR